MGEDLKLSLNFQLSSIRPAALFGKLAVFWSGYKGLAYENMPLCMIYDPYSYNLVGQ